MDQTFTLHPLTLSTTTSTTTIPTLSSPSNPTLHPPLNALNALHRLLSPLPSQIPPPPLPTNPKRTAQVQKMRDQGNAALRRSTTNHPSTNHPPPPSSTTTTTPHPASEAITLYTYALEMALGRPGWEPSALVREEASALYANRAQAYMHAGMWPEGAADAACSVEMKRGPGNGKAWWRRGKCLVEMGRWKEAREWVARGLEVEGGGNEAEMGVLRREIEREVERRR